MVGVLVVLAMYRLLQPVSGDQALGILIGARLRHGAVMYRDVWDIRQPLTYCWFATVGSVLGPGATSVRLTALPKAEPTRIRNAVSLGVISLVLALTKILYAPLPFVFAVVWVVAHPPSRRVATRAVAWVWLVAVCTVFLAREWWPYQPLAALAAGTRT